jgi:hypothetical protein
MLQLVAILSLIPNQAARFLRCSSIDCMRLNLEGFSRSQMMLPSEFGCLLDGKHGRQLGEDEGHQSIMWRLTAGLVF